ncbi:MAG: hypothetical protein J6D87_10295 [Clostridia bacterium]|nr:hypothetical protein [Clostridia bacterium]MBQ7315542.1 hypothetical protein [Clostridia bacterium]
MGFGLLLCGYFVLTFMSFGVGEYSFAAYIIGGFITANAAYRLKDYCPRFMLTVIAGCVYMLLGVYDVLFFLDELFLWGVMPVGTLLPSIIDGISICVELFFHISLLWGVMLIATDVEEQKIRSGSIRNLTFSIIWGVGQLILVLFPALAAFQQQVFTKLLLLVVLVTYVLNVLLLHSCYRNICPAGEELGSPMKRSRFAFVNKINDRFEEKSARALKESMEYSQKKREEREEKRMSNKKKRK